MATFLARAYTRTGDRRLPAVLDGAARAMMARKWRLGLAYCHGLAGNGDTLLETAEVLGSSQHAAWAADLGAMTVEAVRRDAVSRVAGPAPAGAGDRMTADFQVGLGGVLAFLARLDVPGPRLWLPPLYPGPAAVADAAIPAGAARAPINGLAGEGRPAMAAMTRPHCNFITCIVTNT